MSALCGGDATVCQSPEDVRDSVGAGPDDFSAQILSLWQKPVEETPLAKDLPRLCRRFTIYTSDGEAHAFDEKGEDGMYRRNIGQAVRDIMCVLVGDTEGKEAAEATALAVDEVLEQERVDSNADVKLVLPRLFEILGEDSPAMRLLKYAHQNVVLSAMSHLKDPRTGVMRDHMMKDIRDSHGWRFIINLTDICQVCHVRREQSMDLWGKDEDHFEVEWEVRITFRREGFMPTATTLRITDLQMAETMSPEVEASLRTTIVGDLIVA